MNTVTSCVLFVIVFAAAALLFPCMFRSRKEPGEVPRCFCRLQTPQEMAENGCHDCEYRAACDPDGGAGDFMLGARNAEEDIRALGINAAWRKHTRQVKRDGAMNPYTRGYRRGLANHVSETNRKNSEEGGHE